jgi:hypothetical protein
MIKLARLTIIIALAIASILIAQAAELQSPHARAGVSADVTTSYGCRE